jgi:hypothetical protein
MSAEYEIGLRVFEEIRAKNPALQMDLDRNPKGMLLEMRIPKQPGLAFTVELNLQNSDELHLVAGPFWCEWFPCFEPAKVEEYMNAVNGLLSGQFRIELHARNGKARKAILQKPVGSSWGEVAVWSRIHWPIGKKSVEYVQNESNT